jgi:hypothetical protein
MLDNPKLSVSHRCRTRDRNANPSRNKSRRSGPAKTRAERLTAGMRTSNCMSHSEPGATSTRIANQRAALAARAQPSPTELVRPPRPRRMKSLSFAAVPHPFWPENAVPCARRAPPEAAHRKV